MDKQKVKNDLDIYTDYQYQKEKGYDSFVRKIKKVTLKFIDDLKVKNDALKEKNRINNFGKARKKVAKRNAKKSK